MGPAEAGHYDRHCGLAEAGHSIAIVIWQKPDMTIAMSIDSDG